MARLDAALAGEGELTPVEAAERQALERIEAAARVRAAGTA